jgi:hypothetical protein
MAEPTVQNYANHTRLDPMFHFVLLPLAVFLLLSSIWSLIKNPGYGAFLACVIAVLIFLEAGLLRSYSLKAQDRVIRLEERLRLASLLPEAQRARIGELTERQLIALRFASDAELPALAMKAVDQKLPPKEIKQAIHNWRPDYFRV